jgi:chorismate synthase
MRFFTAGESHGKCLLAILEGMPAGLRVDVKAIDQDLARRQAGYGRGGRMTIEKDKAEILSGIKNGRTLGTPISIRIPNRDFKIDILPRVTRPRPGHADLSGVLKYNRSDVRDILERASARETTARVAVGSLCKQIASHVTCIGGVTVSRRFRFEEIQKKADLSPVRCCEPAASRAMMERIDFAKANKDTLGGTFEVWIKGLPKDLTRDKALESRLVFGLMSIQAVKGVEILGPGPLLSAAMKPISTLMKPLRSADIVSKKPVVATVERSDVTAVPACAVVAEAMAAFEIAGFTSDIRHRL